MVPEKFVNQPQGLMEALPGNGKYQHKAYTELLPFGASRRRPEHRRLQDLDWGWMRDRRPAAAGAAGLVHEDAQRPPVHRLAVAPVEKHLRGDVLGRAAERVPRRSR